MSDTKPRVRMPAGSSRYTSDSFNNFSAALGYGTNNLTSASTYGFNPLSRNRTLLEWMYRGSWIVKQIVDSVADDMTREGITIESDMPPDDTDKIHQYFNEKLIWQRLNSTIKWARLYGGCIAVIMIDGQKTETPLNIDRVTKDQFKGLLVLDRWMVWPHLEAPVTELGQDYGLPSFYEVVADAKSVPNMRIHHTRCIRLEGVELPYFQRIAENNWGLSVIEPMYDRIIAFDSTTQGTAQLVYRAHLRTLKIEKLRELIAFGGEGYQAVLKQIEMIRLMQTNEAMTILDSTDEFEAHQYSFGGLSDVLIQFSQQLSGAAQIPLTRLFGQSPAGMNATGESDLRNYYDAVNAQQESRLRGAMRTLLEITHRSVFGTALPDGFDFSFSPLWQMNNDEKANIASTITTAVAKAVEDAIITPAIALKELRQSSKVTGIYSNITDEDIAAAEEAPPAYSELGAQLPGGPANPDEMQRQHELGMQQGSQAHEQALKQQDDEKAQARADRPQASSEAKQSGAREDSPDSSTRKAVAHLLSLDSLPPEIDFVLGPEPESEAVWLLEQTDLTNHFEKWQALVGFADRDTAIKAFESSNVDHPVKTIKRISVRKLKEFIGESRPTQVNGASIVP